jgi:hypothetical protein
LLRHRGLTEALERGMNSPKIEESDLRVISPEDPRVKSWPRYQKQHKGLRVVA